MSRRSKPEAAPHQAETSPASTTPLLPLLSHDIFSSSSSTVLYNVVVDPVCCQLEWVRGRQLPQGYSASRTREKGGGRSEAFGWLIASVSQNLITGLFPSFGKKRSQHWHDALCRTDKRARPSLCTHVACGSHDATCCSNPSNPSNSPA